MRQLYLAVALSLTLSGCMCEGYRAADRKTYEQIAPIVKKAITNDPDKVEIEMLLISWEARCRPSK
jgi:hypothetical protein